MTCSGAGGENHLLRLDNAVANLELPHLAARRTFAADKRTVTVDQGDLVLLEEPLDTGGELFDDTILTAHHLGNINGRRPDSDTLCGKPVRCFLEEM